LIPGLPIFLAPITGLVACAIGCLGVLLLYMLRLRRRPVSVSSTMLWSRAVKDMEGNVPWQRLSPSVLLLVHLLIVILLSMAIARPVFDGMMGDHQRVYLVVDTSASMKAQADGASAIDRAKEQAIERAKGLFDSGRSPSVSVIEAGLQPRVVLADSDERGRVVAAIQSLQATDQGGDLVEAIGLIERLHEAALAQENLSEDTESAEEQLAPEDPALVWVFSDGGSIDSSQGMSIPMRSGAGVSVTPFGDRFDGDRPMPNSGVLAVGSSRDRSDPDVCRLFVRVGRNSAGPKAAVIRVYEGDQEITNRAIVFEDSVQTQGETFELRLAQEALLRIELDVDDALAADNVAWVRVPDPDPVRITVVAPDGQADPLLVDMLEVIARTRVLVVEPDDQAAYMNGDADLVVFDRVDAATLPASPTIGFASSYPGRLGEDVLATSRRTRMISWDRADPMVRDASVGAVSYTRSVVLPEESAERKTRVLARDRDGSVIVERVIAGHRHVRLAFALHDSNWAVQVGLPIFLVNAVDQLLPGAGGLGEVYTTRELIKVDGDAGTSTVGPFAEIGTRTIEGNTIGISLLDPQESAMSVRTGVVIGAGDPERMGRTIGYGQRSLWRWFTLAAIVLLALEWFAYAAKVKIN
tara:strand:- start:68964 stop:70880 length:1917 start_codon:yes stop_codon:yes gene_type:complete